VPDVAVSSCATLISVPSTNVLIPRFVSAVVGPVIVAPKSAYTAPMLMVAGLLPFTAMTGAVEVAEPEESPPPWAPLPVAAPAEAVCPMSNLSS